MPDTKPQAATRAPGEDLARFMNRAVTNFPTAVATLFDYLDPSGLDDSEEKWAEAFIDRLLTMPGTGHATLLDDIFAELGVYYTDEVDDNPERNPHVGFVEATGSGPLARALLRWRAGKEPEPDPFAIHIVNISSNRDGIYDYTVSHDPDCDRLPYGQLCAFDKVAAQCHPQSYLPIPSGLAPGEYPAWVLLGHAGDRNDVDCIHVGMLPMVRLGSPQEPEANFPGAPGSFWADKDGDLWATLPDGSMAHVQMPETGADYVRDYYGPMRPMSSDDLQQVEREPHDEPRTYELSAPPMPVEYHTEPAPGDFDPTGRD